MQGPTTQTWTNPALLTSGGPSLPWDPRRAQPRGPATRGQDLLGQVSIPAQLEHATHARHVETSLKDTAGYHAGALHTGALQAQPLLIPSQPDYRDMLHQPQLHANVTQMQGGTADGRLAWHEATMTRPPTGGGAQERDHAIEQLDAEMTHSSHPPSTYGLQGAPSDSTTAYQTSGLGQGTHQVLGNEFLEIFKEIRNYMRPRDTGDESATHGTPPLA